MFFFCCFFRKRRNGFVDSRREFLYITRDQMENYVSDRIMGSPVVFSDAQSLCPPCHETLDDNDHPNVLNFEERQNNSVVPQSSSLTNLVVIQSDVQRTAFSTTEIHRLQEEERQLTVPSITRSKSMVVRKETPRTVDDSMTTVNAYDRQKTYTQIVLDQMPQGFEQLGDFSRRHILHLRTNIAREHGEDVARMCDAMLVRTFLKLTLIRKPARRRFWGVLPFVTPRHVR